jgi:hypothetical protein
MKVSIVMGSKKSIGLDGMTAVRAVITDICGMPETRVIVKEDGERLMKYHVKVYFDSVNTAAEMQPTLRVETILAVLRTDQVPYSLAMLAFQLHTAQGMCAYHLRQFSLFKASCLC